MSYISTSNNYVKRESFYHISAKGVVFLPRFVGSFVSLLARLLKSCRRIFKIVNVEENILHVCNRCGYVVQKKRFCLLMLMWYQSRI